MKKIRICVVWSPGFKSISISTRQFRANDRLVWPFNSIATVRFWSDIGSLSRGLMFNTRIWPGRTHVPICFQCAFIVLTEPFYSHTKLVTLAFHLLGFRGHTLVFDNVDDRINKLGGGERSTRLFSIVYVGIDNFDFVVVGSGRMPSWQHLWVVAASWDHLQCCWTRDSLGFLGIAFPNVGNPMDVCFFCFWCFSRLVAALLYLWIIDPFNFYM